MKEHDELNKLEHYLLSKLTDDIEPLFILYSDSIRDIRGTSLDLILQSLINLINLNFSNCLQKKWGKWRSCKKLTITTLQKRFAGLSEANRTKYPNNVAEYYFEITEKGRIEQAKEIYDKYHNT